MMEEENQLIKYLNSNGFVGEKLEEDVKRQQELFNSVFKVRHNMLFGEDEMTFEMNVIYDRQFFAYRLTGYHATLRESFIIEHKILGGIDTAALERDMSAIDWNRHFFEKQTISVTELLLAEQILNQVDNLAEIRDFDANQISEQLQFKYFPPDIYAEVAIEDYSQVYQQQHEFTANEFGIPSAFLAYHTLSGNLQNMYDSLREIGLDNFTYTDLKSLLGAYLSRNPDKFTIYGNNFNDNGIVDIKMDFVKDNASYQAADTFEVTFSPYPEITHITTSTIDTLLLEEKFKMVNWQEDELITIDKDEVFPLPHIKDMIDEVEKLSAYPGGEEIADYLKMKYWSNNSAMEIYIDDITHERWNSLPKISQSFPMDFKIQAAMNLVLGKPVMAKSLEKSGENFNLWFIIDPTTKATNGLNPLEPVQGLSIKEVEIMLRMLPLSGSVDVSMELYSLSRGDRIKINLMGINGEQSVEIAANPREKIIDVFAEDGEKIPFNFRLDTAWKPATTDNLLINTREDLKQPIHQQSSTKQPPKKRYGRGL